MELLLSYANRALGLASSRRAIALFVLAMLTTFIIAACGIQGDRHPISEQGRANPDSSSTSTECRLIQHEMGETKVCGQPQKIVVLGPNMLELLLSLNLQPAGFADRYLFHQSDYDNPAQQIPYLGKQITTRPINVGLAHSPSIEALLKIKPDLILGGEFNKSQYETLSKIAPTLLFTSFDTKNNLRALAKAMRHPERAERLLAETEQQVARVREKLSPVVAAHSQVLMLTSDPQLAQNILITNRNSFCGSLVANLGFRLVHPPGLAQSALSQLIPIPLETLPQLNKADLIILLGFNETVNQLTDMNSFEKHQLSVLKQQWQKKAIAQSLDASKAGRVYFIPAYLCLGLPGPIGTEVYLNELEEQLLLPQ